MGSGFDVLRVRFATDASFDMVQFLKSEMGTMPRVRTRTAAKAAADRSRTAGQFGNHHFNKKLQYKLPLKGEKIHP